MPTHGSGGGGMLTDQRSYTNTTQKKVQQHVFLPTGYGKIILYLIL